MMKLLSFIKKPRKPKTDKKPVVLLSLDGWGIANGGNGNAIAQANTPYMTSYQSQFPHGILIASGESVGLPANEVGNSEVGHLTMGAGRVIYQSLKKIGNAIADGSFFRNEAFLAAAEHTKTHSSKLHLLGLVGSGNVHSSTEHLIALLEFCKREDLTNVCLHLFTDGRDSAPQESEVVIKSIEDRLKELNLGRVCTISGRYYAMDRDGRWERTQAAYEAMIMGKGPQFKSSQEAISSSYANNPSDEFVVPSVILDSSGNATTIDDNDAVIFFNFRVDRSRQLSLALSLPDFEQLKAFDWGFEPDQGKTEKNLKTGPTFRREKWPKNLFFVTMTEYQKNIPVSAIAYPFDRVDQTLSSILGDAQKKHLHLAESEKERMVTYYFNGMKDVKIPGEEVVIVRSPKVPTYENKPEMAVFDIVKEFKRALYKEEYDFYMINFANPDMVAHTGNLQATIKAIEFTDKAVGELVTEALLFNATVFISADHGNAEELLTFQNNSFFFTTREGSRNTDHSNNPVPLLVISNEFQGQNRELPKGSLSDIAPTILAYMNLPKPPVMTGRNLLE